MMVSSRWRSSVVHSSGSSSGGTSETITPSTPAPCAAAANARPSRLAERDIGLVRPEPRGVRESVVLEGGAEVTVLETHRHAGERLEAEVEPFEERRAARRGRSTTPGVSHAHVEPYRRAELVAEARHLEGRGAAEARAHPER